MNNLSYIHRGDYLIPNVILREIPSNTPPLGRYGRMHKAYLREHRPILYDQLLLTERLFPILREIDKTANERKARGVAEEAILSELVFV